jgi:outer membrane lipoprotein-sorting protein
MKNLSLKLNLILVLLLVLIVSSPAIAQRGGKAEPNRIEFKRGANSTTISGTVRGDEQAEYVLSARQGQRLIIKLTSVPSRSSVFDLHAPDDTDLGLEYDANYDYSGKLPKTGDYLIFVTRPTQAKGTSKYRLTVTVR